MALSLQKDQRLSLKKPDNTPLDEIFIGLGWDASDCQGDVDLDANFSTFGANKAHLEDVYYGRKSGCNNAVSHGGDNRTGEGAGDDERIQVQLSKLPANAEHCFVSVTSYTSHKFNVVKNAYVRIVDKKTGDELCRFNLTEKYDSTAIVMARIYRKDGEWKIHAMGAPAEGIAVTQIRASMIALIP